MRARAVDVVCVLTLDHSGVMIEAAIAEMGIAYVQKPPHGRIWQCDALSRCWKTGAGLDPALAFLFRSPPRLDWIASPIDVLKRCFAVDERT